MRVRIHELFETFLDAHAAEPEVSLVHSLAQPPSLGRFLDDLDPHMSLDWSGQSFMGLPLLRERVVKHWGYAPVCAADDVLITAGTAEANFLAINNLVGPGDEMIVDVPGWPQPLVLAEAIGAKVRKLERVETSGWMFDFGQLEDLVNAKTKLIFICNPNNPTGHVLDQGGLQRVVELADRFGAWVLTDEVYRAMEWEGQDTPRVASLYERGISTGSVSKVLGLQGLRTGWMVCRDHQLLFDSMVLREDSSEIMNVMGEAIAAVALQENRFAEAIGQARRAGRRNLDLIDAFIQSQPSLSWVRPCAGLIGFCKTDLGMDSKELSRRLLEPPYRTFVMPGTAYGYPRHLRLGAGGGEAREVAEGLRRLCDFLEHH